MIGVKEAIVEIAALEKVDPYRVESGEERLDRVLRMLIITMCLVSFMATAQGLLDNVFIGYPFRAYAVSFVIQAVIFIFSMRILRPENKRIKKGFRALFVIAYAMALIASVVFDFTFICNAAYSQNHEGVQGNDVYLSTQYNDILQQADKYAKGKYEVLATRLAATLADVEGAVEKDSLEIDVSEFEDEAYSEVSQLVSRTGALMSHTATQAELTALEDDLNARIGLLRSDVNVLQQSVQDNTDGMNYYQWRYDEVGTARDLLDIRQNAADRILELQELIRCCEVLLGYVQAAQESATHMIASSLDSIARTLMTSQSDVDISAEIRSIADQIAVTSSSDRKQMVSDLKTVRSLKVFADDWSALYGMMENLKACHNYLETGMGRSADAGASLADDFGNEFDEKAWVHDWSSALTSLRGALEAALPIDDGGVSGFNDLIDRVNKLERERLGYISDLEQAFQYLENYPYPELARISMLIALFLDLGSLGIGMFSNARLNKLEGSSNGA